jgi:hypothetical protein
MKVKIEIDDETLDAVFRENLAWHINNTKTEIKRLNKFIRLSDDEAKEKLYLENLLPALKTVGKYFGVK